MNLYICSKDDRKHDLDFLQDYDMLKIIVNPEDFSLKNFADEEANQYVDLKYLIIDIMAIHDDQDELISSLTVLNAYLGIIPVIYATENNRVLKKVYQSIESRGIKVFNEHTIKDGLTEIFSRLYKIVPAVELTETQPSIDLDENKIITDDEIDDINQLKAILMEDHR